VDDLVHMRLLVCVSAVFVAGALPSIANAADYCVAPNASCDQTHTVATVQAALNKADDLTDADRILLGAKTYVAPSTAGYAYNAVNSPVEIVGVGVGETVVTAPPGAHEVLDLHGGAGTVVRDLTIQAPANAGYGWALWTNNTARHVEVTEDGTQSTAHGGVYLDQGGVLEDSSVNLSALQDNTGIFLTNGGVLRRSEIRANTGVQSNTGSIERSVVHGETTGLYAYDGVTTISASTIDIEDGIGIYAESYTGVPVSSVTADGVTISGTGATGNAGAFADTTGGTGESAVITLKNSVIRRFPIGLKATAGTGVAKVATSYADYDPSGNLKSGAKAAIDEAHMSNVGDAGFVNAAGGDYHLLPGSPLVDAGDPATAPGLDLDGKPLVTDGDGDGVARRDIGAYERPAAPAKPSTDPPADTAAPVVSGLRATPRRFRVGRASTPSAARTRRGTTLRFGLSEAARVALRIQRKRAVRSSKRFRTIGTLYRGGRTGANRIRFTGRIGKRALRAGAYRVLVTATDAAGNRSAARIVRFRVVRR